MANKTYYDEIADIEQSSESTAATLPIDVLPEALQQLAADAATAYQCPFEYAAASMVSAASCMIGKRRWCSFGEHKNFATLWFALVGDSSSAKTGVLSFFYRPIQLIERDSFEAYTRDLAQWKASTDSARPVWQHRIVNNPTDENLLQELAINKDITWKMDELRGMFESFGQFKRTGGGTIIANILSIFNNEDVSVTRVSGDNRYLDTPNHNIVGGIQPAVLARIINKQNFTDDGLFQRFLFVYPDKHDVQPWSDVKVSPELKAYWETKTRTLLGLYPQSIDETPEAAALHISVINKWRELCNTQYADDAVMLSTVRKMEIHLCRLSVVFATLAGADYITPDIVTAAADWCMYFIATSQKVLKYMRNDSDIRLDASKKSMYALINYYYPDLKAADVAKGLGVDLSNFCKHLRLTKDVIPKNTTA